MVTEFQRFGAVIDFETDDFNLKPEAVYREIADGEEFFIRKVPNGDVPVRVLLGSWALHDGSFGQVDFHRQTSTTSADQRGRVSLGVFGVKPHTRYYVDVADNGVVQLVPCLDADDWRSASRRVPLGLVA